MFFPSYEVVCPQCGEAIHISFDHQINLAEDEIVCPNSHVNLILPCILKDDYPNGVEKITEFDGTVFFLLKKRLFQILLSLGFCLGLIIMFCNFNSLPFKSGSSPILIIRVIFTCIFAIFGYIGVNCLAGKTQINLKNGVGSIVRELFFFKSISQFNYDSKSQVRVAPRLWIGSARCPVIELADNTGMVYAEITPPFFIPDTNQLLELAAHLQNEISGGRLLSGQARR